MPPFTKFFVNPVTGRNELSVPPYRADTVPQNNMDFNISGVPAKITVMDIPGTLVLITPTAGYPAANQSPPSVGQVAGAAAAYSTVTGSDGKTVVKVPAGVPYFITCWRNNKRIGNESTPVQTPNTSLLPSGTPTVACPQ